MTRAAPLLLLVACQGAPAGRDSGDGVGDPPDCTDALELPLTACDGAPASPAELCGSPALITAWYGWCPTCNDNAILGRALADEHAELGVAVVLIEDPAYAPADAGVCEQYEATYPSRVRTWLDPESSLVPYGEMDLVLVLDRNGSIAFQRETSTESTIRGAVDAALSE